MRRLASIQISPKFRHLGYTKFDFLYHRDGPWPQLMPDRPMGDLPEVVKVPPAEAKQYKRLVTLVYLWRLFKTSIKGVIYAWTHNRYQDFDDERFTRQLTEGVYSKFLFAWPDDPAADRGIGEELADVVASKRGSDPVFYCDFNMIACIKDDCLPNNFVAPTTVAFRNTGQYRFEVLALKINELVLEPEHGDAWTLAKYFALQAAEYSIKFIYHIGLHFPFDTVNALTKSALPTEHIIFKLLQPQLLLSLPVNNAVLESPNSVVSDDPNKSPFYAPFATKSAYVRKMLHLATDGIDGHFAYPTYDFFKVRPLNCRANDENEKWRTKAVPSRFCDVMSRYWQPYYDFAEGVVTNYRQRIERLNRVYNELGGDMSSVEDELKEVDLDKLCVWADQIAHFLDGFPQGSEFIKGDPGSYEIDAAVLTEALATIMWTVSLAHAMDHVDDARIWPDEKPYRIRMPAPESKSILPFPPEQLVDRWDFFPSLLILKTFTTPITSCAILDMKYSFKPNSGLNALAEKFFDDIRATARDIEAERSLDRDTKDKDKQWIRLKDVACSVQY